MVCDRQKVPVMEITDNRCVNKQRVTVKDAVQSNQYDIS
jgi:hypothetical protein